MEAFTEVYNGQNKMMYGTHFERASKMAGMQLHEHIHLSVRTFLCLTLNFAFVKASFLVLA